VKRIAALDAELADNRQALDSAVNAQIRTQITDRTIGTAFRDGWLPPPDRQPGRRARQTSSRSREPVSTQRRSGLLAPRSALQVRAHAVKGPTGAARIARRTGECPVEPPGVPHQTIRGNHRTGRGRRPYDTRSQENRSG